MARDHGYLAYSQVIFTTEEALKNYPIAIADFLEATQAGWEYASAHRQSTVDLIIEKYNTDLDREYQLASLNRVLELVKPEGRLALAPMDRRKWEMSMARFIDHGILEKEVDLDPFLDFSLNP
jgi:ABC-type nitrate/sulfonate/bicarbonate transport system substrate-binding protein